MSRLCEAYVKIKRCRCQKGTHAKRTLCGGLRGAHKHVLQEIPSRHAAFRRHEWDRIVFCGEVLGKIARIRSLLKSSGRLQRRPDCFFLGKYWAECEKSGRPPFGDYNIIREDECTGRSPWRSLQHCTRAPRPNGNCKTLVPGPLQSRLFNPGGCSVPSSV